MADPIMLEIDGKILRNLIERDRLTVSDFRCFNQESKKKIREIYLQITKNKPVSYTHLTLPTKRIV